MKKMVVLLLLAVLLLVPAVNVKAATLANGNYVGDASGSFVPPSFVFDENLMSSEAVKDEAGRFKSGYFYFNSVSNGWRRQRNNLYSSDDGYLYITRTPIPNNSLDEGLTGYLFEVWTSTSCDRIYVDANYEYNEKNEPSKITWYDVYHYVPNGVSGMHIGGLNMPINCNSDVVYEYDEVKNNLGFYCTNLPVFNEEDTDAIERYKQSGDYSGSVNEGTLDFNNTDVEQDDSVELPRNPMTYGRILNKIDIKYSVADGEAKPSSLNVRWYPPIKNLEDYSYDLRVKVHYQDCSDRKYYDTDYSLCVSNFPYSGRSTVDINTGLPVSRGSDIPEDFNIDEDLLKKQGFKFVKAVTGNVTSCWVSTKTGQPVLIKTVTIQIRNRVGDKCSNWATVTSTAGGGSSVYVHDDDDNPVPTDDYDNPNIDNNDNHITDEFADKNISNVDFSTSLKGIMNYIRSGFGLLGNYGLISLITGLFSYIPASVWTLLKAGIAMVMVVALARIVVSAISGLGNLFPK